MRSTLCGIGRGIRASATLRRARPLRRRRRRSGRRMRRVACPSTVSWGRAAGLRQPSSGPSAIVASAPATCKPRTASAHRTAALLEEPAWRTTRDAVLFVCLGNICRSPTAEGVFRAALAQRGLSRAVFARFGRHRRLARRRSRPIGAPSGRPPPRLRSHGVARSAGERRGFRALRLDPRDGPSNLRALERMRPHGTRATSGSCSISCRRRACAKCPIPTTAAADGFERVLDLVEHGERGARHSHPRASACRALHAARSGARSRTRGRAAIASTQAERSRRSPTARWPRTSEIVAGIVAFRAVADVARRRVASLRLHDLQRLLGDHRPSADARGAARGVTAFGSAAGGVLNCVSTSSRPESGGSVSDTGGNSGIGRGAATARGAGCGSGRRSARDVGRRGRGAGHRRDVARLDGRMERRRDRRRGSNRWPRLRDVERRGLDAARRHAHRRACFVTAAGCVSASAASDGRARLPLARSGAARRGCRADADRRRPRPSRSRPLRAGLALARQCRRGLRSRPAPPRRPQAPGDAARGARADGRGLARRLPRARLARLAGFARFPRLARRLPVARCAAGLVAIAVPALATARVGLAAARLRLSRS